MECSCSASVYYDNEEYSFSERKLKAAKQHECVECNKPILKNEYFWFSTLFGEGSISNYKTCVHCKELIDIFFDEGYTIGQIYDDLYSYFDNVWNGDLPSNCISKLTKENKEYICDMFQEFQYK